MLILLTTPAPANSITLGSVGDAADIEFGPTLEGEAGAINMGSVISEPVIEGGLWLTAAVPAGQPIPPRVTAGLYAADNVTLIAELERSFGEEWQDPLNQTGNGSVQIETEDAQAGLFVENRYVRIRVDGQAVFGVRLESPEKVAVDPGEEMAERTSWAGRGPLSEWEQPTVFPDLPIGQLPFADDGTRTFNFASRGYGALRSQPFPFGWTKITTEYVQRTALIGGSVEQRPFGWPDPYSAWIWGRPSADGHPPGLCYFLCDFTLSAANPVTSFATADDDFRFYLDGVEAMRGDPDPAPNFLDGFWSQCQLEAGFHRIGAIAENRDISEELAALGLPPWWPTGNLAGFISSSWTTAGDTYIDDPIVITGGAAELGSFPTWYVKAYPAEPPGWYAGELIWRLFHEAQNRAGMLSGWHLHFTPDTDSAGRPWSNMPEVVVNVGDTYLKVLEQLAEGWVDFAADPAGKVLYLWDKPKGGRGSYRSTAVLRNTGNVAVDNLLQLQRERKV